MCLRTDLKFWGLHHGRNYAEMDKKRARGCYFTRGNPFALHPFRGWAKRAKLSHARLLEPFAGANHIVRTLTDMGHCKNFTSYDITPADKNVRKRDTLEKFPQNFDVCVTNPPWLARNSATFRGLPYQGGAHDNLYKHCLEQCLNHCAYVAALVPASYLQSTLFKKHLEEKRVDTYILLHKTIFEDTQNPVCLTLFEPAVSHSPSIYYDDTYIGDLQFLKEHLPGDEKNKNVRFNDPDGKLGFVSFDNTKEKSIRFCHTKEIEGYDIKISSRFITRISGNFRGLAKLIATLNRQVENFREETQDLF